MARLPGHFHRTITRTSLRITAHGVGGLLGWLIRLFAFHVLERYPLDSHISCEFGHIKSIEDGKWQDQIEFIRS